MARKLDTATLDGYAGDCAAWWLQNRPPNDRAFVQTQLHNLTFKDEFDHIVKMVGSILGGPAGKEFSAMISGLKPRDEKVLAKMLADHLAVDMDGGHIPGKVGKVVIGSRVVGKGTTLRGRPKNLYWPIYAGEGDERAAGSGAVDPLPETAEPLPIGALNTRISNEVAILACDAIVDNIDEGSAGGVIQGRSGAQPADPDTVASGTLLFTLLLSDPAFGNAADDNPGAIATANSITDDSSADATATLGYCRASSSNGQPTPLDDHIDGEAGTSGADFNFNTLSIVSGATVSMTSWTVTMPES